MHHTRHTRHIHAHTVDFNGHLYFGWLLKDLEKTFFQNACLFRCHISISQYSVLSILKAYGEKAE